jgi:hypothetical protein
MYQLSIGATFIMTMTILKYQCMLMQKITEFKRKTSLKSKIADKFKVNIDYIAELSVKARSKKQPNQPYKNYSPVPIALHSRSHHTPTIKKPSGILTIIEGNVKANHIKIERYERNGIEVRVGLHQRIEQVCTVNHQK